MRYRFTPKTYIFLSLTFEGGIPVDGRAIKTNSRMKIVDAINHNLFEKESFNRFILWVDRPNEYLIVSQKPRDFLTFVQYVEKNTKNLTKEIVRILKGSFWNIHNEILHNLKCPQKLSIEQLLRLYRIHPLTHDNALMGKCLNLALLANAYLFDKKTTDEIKEKGYLDVLRQHLKEQSVESLIKQAICNEWKISISLNDDTTGKIELIAQNSHSSVEKRMEANTIQDALVEFHLHVF